MDVPIRWMSLAIDTFDRYLADYRSGTCAAAEPEL
jgi:hypothetical protein